MPSLLGSHAIDIQEVFESYTRPSPTTALEEEWKEKIGKIDLEIFSNRMATIVYEGKEVMVKVGVTPGMTGTDLNCAIYTGGGDMAVSAMGVYAHGVSGQGPAKYFLKYFGESVGIKDGDLLYVSDPFLGGTHVNDQFLLAPIFDGEELVAFVASGCHQSDVGAAEVGMASSNTNRFEDGRLVFDYKMRPGVVRESNALRLMQSIGLIEESELS